MEKYGFPGVSAFDIVETGKQVREEIATQDPEKAAALYVYVFHRMRIYFFERMMGRWLFLGLWRTIEGFHSHLDFFLFRFLFSVSSQWGLICLGYGKNRFCCICGYNNRTHTEIRELAIRREMKKMILKRKLKETADDWATPVASLTANVKKHAET